jgi:hypothetical protein
MRESPINTTANENPSTVTLCYVTIWNLAEITPETRYLGLGRIFIATSSADTEELYRSLQVWCSGNPQPSPTLKPQI